jgi:hypothetical protein
MAALYEPNAYFARARRAVRALRRPNLGIRVQLRDSSAEFGCFLAIMWEVTRYRPEMRRHVWRMLIEAMIRNPLAVRYVLGFAVFYLFLGPLSRFMIERAQARIAEIDAKGAAPSPISASDPGERRARGISSEVRLTG